MSTELAAEVAEALVRILSPGGSLVAISDLAGSFSNYTHLVEARSPDGALSRYVVRRYATFGYYDRGEKARREFKAFELLRRQGLPVPEPVYLDDSGALLGIPGIVTRHVSGVMLMQPSDPSPWAHALADTLARIHATPCDATSRSFLLDANAEALWFLRGDVLPDYVRAHPQGAMLWQAVRELLPLTRQVPPTLVHIDYWRGNILWDGDRIVAVLDWEEAAYGDPGIDVAYCRMDMLLDGMDEVADEFLSAYEARTGKPVANLGFWEMAAAVRPMFNPVGWISESPTRERFALFVDGAMQRARLERRA